eukprot:6180407-Pleurochrysis_carterae.AAC.3
MVAVSGCPSQTRRLVRAGEPLMRCQASFMLFSDRFVPCARGGRHTRVLMRCSRAWSCHWRSGASTGGACGRRRQSRPPISAAASDCTRAPGPADRHETRNSSAQEGSAKAWATGLMRVSFELCFAARVTLLSILTHFPGALLFARVETLPSLFAHAARLDAAQAAAPL